MPLFRILTPAGIVFQEANAQIYARLTGRMAGLDVEKDTPIAELDAEATRLVPRNMVGRLLTRKDEAELRRIAKRKKPAPAVRPRRG